MTHKTVTKWKGGMLFESDNPSGNKFIMDTISKDLLSSRAYLLKQ